MTIRGGNPNPKKVGGLANLFKSMYIDQTGVMGNVIQPGDDNVSVRSNSSSDSKQSSASKQSSTSSARTPKGDSKAAAGHGAKKAGGQIVNPKPALKEVRSKPPAKVVGSRPAPKAIGSNSVPKAVGPKPVFEENVGENNVGVTLKHSAGSAQEKELSQTKVKDTVHKGSEQIDTSGSTPTKAFGASRVQFKIEGGENESAAKEMETLGDKDKAFSKSNEEGFGRKKHSKLPLIVDGQMVIDPLALPTRSQSELAPTSPGRPVTEPGLTATGGKMTDNLSPQRSEDAPSLRLDSSESSFVSDASVIGTPVSKTDTSTNDESVINHGDGKRREKLRKRKSTARKSRGWYIVQHIKRQESRNMGRTSNSFFYEIVPHVSCLQAIFQIDLGFRPKRICSARRRTQSHSNLCGRNVALN